MPKTTSGMSYADKLKDPRWQRKRLEVLQRANFTCEHCGDTESTLHVHHGYYEKGLEPWEYTASTLHCLCEGCHEMCGYFMRDTHQLLAKQNVKRLDEISGILNNLLTFSDSQFSELYESIGNTACENVDRLAGKR